MNRRLVAVGAAAVLLLAPIGAAPAVSVPNDPTLSDRDQGGIALLYRVDRPVRDPRITESSGLAPSLRHPGTLWTHNDSGGTPTLFALGPDGATRATLRVVGASNVDWEAVQTLREPAGARRPLLAVGDIGDNAETRSRIEIVLLPEPVALRDASAAPALTLRVRYPDRARDAEALLADPRSGRLYLVTKGLLSGEVYAVPTRIWPGRAVRVGSAEVRTGTLKRIGRLPISLATDGAIRVDGSVVLRNYGTVEVYPPIERIAAGAGERLASFPSPRQEQGESLALAGGELLLGSEGARQKIHSIDLDAAAARVAEVAGGDGGTGADPRSGTGEPERTADQPSGAPDRGQTRGAPAAQQPEQREGRDPRLIIAAAAAVAVALAGWVLWLRAGRRRTRRSG